MAGKNTNTAQNGTTEEAQTADTRAEVLRDEIRIDESSGISAEEQREILVQINGIAEKNRKALSGGTQTAGNFKAGKNGGLFPVLVNVFSVLALAGGFFALYTFQSGADTQAREGNRVFNTTERALIEEIRRETRNLLEKKDMEISSILALLDGVDSQLRDLLDGGEVLTNEQEAAQEDLRRMQEDYTASLATLRNERSRILEEARTQEALLQAQLEERTRELSAVAQAKAAELDTARAELSELARQRSRAAAVEAQAAGFFQAVRSHIGEGRYDEAESSITSLQEFLNAPAFQALRSLRPQTDVYLTAADTFRSLLDQRRRLSDAIESGQLPADTEEISRLQEELGGLRASIAAGDAGTARAISSLENSVASLEREKAALQTQTGNLQGQLDSERTRATGMQNELATERTRAGGLEQNVAALNQTVSTRDATIRELESQAATYNQTVSAGEARIQELEAQLTSMREALRTLSQ